MQFELSLTQAIYGAVSASGLMTGAAVFFARFFPFFAVAGALFLILRWGDARARLRHLSLSLLAIIGSWGVATPLIRLFYDRPRPPLLLDIAPLVPLPESGSFPSSHTAFFFALACAIFLMNRRWGIAFFAAAALIGAARVAVGVHWPTDVLAGALLGIAGAYGARYALEWKPAEPGAATEQA